MTQNVITTYDNYIITSSYLPSINDQQFFQMEKSFTNEYDFLMEMEGRQVLFMAFIWLNDGQIQHTRQVYTIFDLLGDLGGVIGAIFPLFALLVGAWNEQLFILKYLSKLYLA